VNADSVAVELAVAGGAEGVVGLAVAQ